MEGVEASLDFLEALTPERIETTKEHVANAAEEELRQARSEARRLRAAARAEGYAAGLAAAHEELRPLIASLASLNEQANKLLEEREQGVARTAVRLAVEMAEIVLHRALALDDTLVVDAAQAALERVRLAGNLRLHVHPRSYDAIDAAIAMLDGIAGPLTVIEDETVEPGGARLYCNDGEYDASPHNEMARLREAIERSLGEEG